jgi:hypothetical protein
MTRQPFAVALVHHPVIDRRGAVVSTAVTNLDLHDIARTARTYDAGRFYVVTPLAEQRVLVARILAHWLEGHGASYNPHRGQALALIKTVATLDEAVEDWRRETDQTVLPVLTSAARRGDLSVAACAERLMHQPLLLVFGTGWGLAPEVFERDWPVLEPIRGAGSYNHLPVRAAAAIMLDRLLGRAAEPFDGAQNKSDDSL